MRVTLANVAAIREVAALLCYVFSADMSLRLLPALLFLALACGERSAEFAEPRRALWVLAEGTHRTLEDPAKIDQLVRDAVELHVSDLFVQVYRSGKSWFPSERADDSPYRAIRAAGHDDPLARVVERAHAAGLRVHAWFNALSLARNERAPLLVRLGRDAVLVDRVGRNLLDYPRYDVPRSPDSYTRLGTPGIWLDPAGPGVIEYLEGTVDDLVKSAPDLDGLHLDYIRHPITLPMLPGSRFRGLDFGYGAASKEGFVAERGGFRLGDAWDVYRREQVGEIVRRLGARLPATWEHSAAVMSYAERAYLTAMQDWRHWLEQGWLDFAVAMAYTRDDTLLRYMIGELRGGVAGDRVWIGVGSWLFVAEPERAAAQLDAALAAVPMGVAIFSYDAIAAAPEARAALGPRPRVGAAE